MLLLAVGVAVATLWYQPKYLHLHHEVEKPYVWAVRSRWIVIAVLGVIAVFWNRSSNSGLVFTAEAIVWLLLVNALVMLLCRQERVLPYRALPWVYLPTDIAVLFVLAGRRLDAMVLLALLLLSTEFAFLLVGQEQSKSFPTLALVPICFIVVIGQHVAGSIPG